MPVLELPACRRPAPLTARLSRYNGVCEAGNSTIKRYAHALAARHGRPHSRTLDDLEAARLLANRRITDRHETYTPERRSDQRPAIHPQQRTALAHAIDAARDLRRAHLAVALSGRRTTITAKALERQAIVDARLGLDYVTIRNKPVRLCNPQRDVV
jgi:hypothetical protein